MVAGIPIRQEIFAISMLTALKPSLEHNRKHVVRLLPLMETVTEIKLHMKTRPAFPLYLFVYSYRLLEKFNREPLSYSLEALCPFPGGG